MTSSSGNVEARVSAADQAIARRIREVAAGKQISQAAVMRQLGGPIDQSYFSRRWRGQTPFTTGLLLAVANILDIDVTTVLAAGAAALEEERRKTNPCLSEGATLGADSIGTWALRGYQMGVRLLGTRRSNLDTDLTAA